MSSEEHLMVLDECMPQEDVARMASSMYSQYIDSGGFFEENDILDDFFSVQENLHFLFDDLK